MNAEPITEPVAQHGEGPVWSPAWGGLRWVDMNAGDVLSLGAGGEIRRRRVGAFAAAVRPRAGGGAVIGADRTFVLEERDGSLRRLPEVWPSGDARMNEGGCDPDGRFYCGSTTFEQTPGAAALYRLDPDLSVTAVLDAVTISNGLDWSPDGTRAYYVDTPTGRVDVFDYDGELHGRRTFAEVDRGNPDGLTVDAEGGVWVALYDGGGVFRFTPDGRLDVVVEVPARKVTACAFGGGDLDELFITTSREGLEPGEDPLAGSLFRVRPGVRGLPVRPFGG